MAYNGGSLALVGDLFRPPVLPLIIDLLSKYNYQISLLHFR